MEVNQDINATRLSLVRQSAVCRETRRKFEKLPAAYKALTVVSATLLNHYTFRIGGRLAFRQIVNAFTKLNHSGSKAHDRTVRKTADEAGVGLSMRAVLLESSEEEGYDSNADTLSYGRGSFESISTQDGSLDDDDF